MFLASSRIFHLSAAVAGQDQEITSKIFYSRLVERATDGEKDAGGVWKRGAESGAHGPPAGRRHPRDARNFRLHVPPCPTTLRPHPPSNRHVTPLSPPAAPRTRTTSRPRPATPRDRPTGRWGRVRAPRAPCQRQRRHVGSST
jgi:hypothetical protein